MKNPWSRDEIREYLNPIYDLERLISRISYTDPLIREIWLLLHLLWKCFLISNRSWQNSNHHCLQRLYEDMDPLDRHYAR